MVNEFDEYPHFFEVSLEQFSGPIDLLLHLVKSHELPIEKLSLANVTAQYLQCLERMRRFDLDIAGEYLLIAATLLSIKSSVLLDEPAEMVIDEEGNVIDPHEELLRRLKEAEVFKRGAVMLEECGQLGIDVFAPPSGLKSVQGPPPSYKDHDPLLLCQAFQGVLKGAGDGDEYHYTVTLEAVSIVDRMMAVLDLLRSADKPVVFYRLIPDITSKGAIIGTFISLLELCKRQIISVHQSDESEEIMVALSSERSAEELSALEFSSEFDGGEAEVAHDVAV